ncbi:NAD(P)H-dependent oxidoreductase [Sphingopyxis sp. BSN-002]|uniref:NAD(P)H-dependent oxidoreductase n=1 Tax=Sphingopyxis sp. BSN-002 TaxID=2911495 RepID=UPI001EDC6F17|nr:NAD(P)H-dependent oxidoreductase [Sphingopyxis sp. BSN-002]UKK85549.1 NAD(P)H-dependent oxidoreductase [Sphingopyxis sp. BSN-002]
MKSKRITLIDGHPDPDPSRFVHALADTYAAAASAAGHEVRRIDVARIEFGLLSSRDVWENGPMPRAIAEAQEDIAWAEHLVVFYPLWLGDLPALLKGFFEQVMRPGFAFHPRPKGFPEKALKGRTAHSVVTMGMPAFFYRFYFGAHSLRSLERNILGFVGIAPVERSIVGNVEGDPVHRIKWLEAMTERGAAGR